MSTHPPNPERHRLQFRTRTLLVLTLFLSVLLAWFGAKWRKAKLQERVVEAAEDMGFQFLYDYQHTHVAGDSNPTSTQPHPERLQPDALGKTLGRDFSNDATYVYINDPNFDGSGLERLCNLPKLQILHLGGTEVTDASLEHLTRMSHIKTLLLQQCPNITDETMKHIASLKQLETLDVWQTSIGDSGLEHIGRLTNLLSLGLDETEISDAGLEHIRKMQNLRTLNIFGTRITDQGLAVVKSLPNLEELRLSRTNVTNEGLNHIVALKHLRVLDLGWTQITDEGVKKLKELPPLESLSLLKTRVTQSGVRDLKRAWPSCVIYWP